MTKTQPRTAAFNLDVTLGVHGVEFDVQVVVTHPDGMGGRALMVLPSAFSPESISPLVQALSDKGDESARILVEGAPPVLDDEVSTETDTSTLNVEATLDNGVSFDVQVEVTYPLNLGAVALAFLPEGMTNQFFGDVLFQMASKGDESALSLLLAAAGNSNSGSVDE